jgi:hypothetical protein
MTTHSFAHDFLALSDFRPRYLDQPADRGSAHRRWLLRQAQVRELRWLRDLPADRRARLGLTARTLDTFCDRVFGTPLRLGSPGNVVRRGER